MEKKDGDPEAIMSDDDDEWPSIVLSPRSGKSTANGRSMVIAFKRLLYGTTRVE